MQRFTLIHDGSEQGWQAAYLAFHIATLLGAPLHVLIDNSETDKKTIAQRAAQVEVGGRAAKVVIGTQLVTDFSADTVAKNAADTDGIFVPRSLVPDEETALGLLKVLPCPLWIVSQEAEMSGAVTLVGNPTADKTLINYTNILSQRIQQPLTGLILESELEITSKAYEAITWHPLSDFSPQQISIVLKQLNVNLLFASVSYIDLVAKLPINCVVWPDLSDA